MTTDPIRQQLGATAVSLADADALLQSIDPNQIAPVVGAKLLLAAAQIATDARQLLDRLRDLPKHGEPAMSH